MDEGTSARPEEEEAGSAWKAAATAVIIANRAGDEIRALRAELEALRAELAAGVRTRHLVVVDEHDAERIVVDATTAFGSVTVLGADGLQATLTASEESQRSNAGLYIGDDENTVRVFLEVNGLPGDRRGRAAGVPVRID